MIVGPSRAASDDARVTQNVTAMTLASSRNPEENRGNFQNLPGTSERCYLVSGFQRYLTTSKKPPKLQGFKARWDNINLLDEPTYQDHGYQVPATKMDRRRKVRTDWSPENISCERYW
jgi:hypothetical protein